MSSSQDTPYRAASFKAPEKPSMVWQLSWTKEGSGFPVMETGAMVLSLLGLGTSASFIFEGPIPPVLRAFGVFGVFLTVWLALFLRRVPR